MHKLKWCGSRQELVVPGKKIVRLVPLGAPVILRTYGTSMEDRIAHEIKGLGMEKVKSEINAYSQDSERPLRYAQLYHVELENLSLKERIAGRLPKTPSNPDAESLMRLREDWSDYTLMWGDKKPKSIKPIGVPFELRSKNIGCEFEIGAFPLKGFDEDLRREAHSQNYRGFNSSSARFGTNFFSIGAIIQLYYAVLEKEGE